MSEDRVSITITDGIADVRMTRADKRNALDNAMFSALAEAGERLKTEPGVRVVVLSGEGSSFCAGLDFATMSAARRWRRAARRAPSGNPGEMKEGRITHLGQQVCWVWQEVPGAGHRRGARPRARRRHPDRARRRHPHRAPRHADERPRGALGPRARHDRHVDAVAARRAPTWPRSSCFTARVFDGREAQAARPGHQAVSETPYDDAMALAREIAGRSPDAVRAAKALLNGLFNQGAAEQFAAERTGIGSLIGRPNQKEAVMSNFEKRPAELHRPELRPTCPTSTDTGDRPRRS